MELGILKKLTQEYVDDYCTKNGYINKSVYIKYSEKLKLICPNNHEIQMPFSTFKRGHRCPLCYGNKKLTQEYVDEYYKSYGYTNKSVYINSKKLNTTICPNNHECKISFNSFKDGHRCFICNGNPTHTQEYVDNYFQKEGWTNHSIYKNNKTKLNVTCPEGHNQQKEFRSFVNGRRCKICHYKNNTGANNPCYKTDRTRQSRMEYLKFNIKKLHILSDDPLYQSYILSKTKAKDSSDKWRKSDFHVDHIYPRVAFIDNDLDKIYNPLIVKKICNLRENLRIITKEENGSKGGVYDSTEFLKWFENKYKSFKNIK